MQQAYSAIRIISEAQTIRIVLSTQPDDLVLKELSAACASFGGAGSEGIKAVVLDFTRTGHEDGASPASHVSPAPAHAERAYHAVRAVAQPVLAVVRDTLSPVASGLLAAADFTLVNEHAFLTIAVAKEGEDEGAGEGNKQTAEAEMLRGAQAARMRYATWAAGAGDLNREMERILNILRDKSAVALRLAKAGTRLASPGQAEQTNQETPLEALQRINTLYLLEVMRTQDAGEGLSAFLEKRKPIWRNR